ncbi:hypothetical protein D5086_027359 [Populus alba]|uniref:Uncharacterized protein n=1 Tax=Populus alba TaxID=43335 RepID=A0ACC4AV88_POPAL
MGTPLMETVYKAASEGKWDLMKEAYDEEHDMYVMSPITVSEDTPLHLAVYSKKVQPLKALLDIADKNPMLGNPCTKENAYGNTVLHEAVFAGNMEAVEHLLQFTPKEQGNYHPSMQLETENALGETPLYRAASCGKKEIVEPSGFSLSEELSDEVSLSMDRSPLTSSVTSPTLTLVPKISGRVRSSFSIGLCIFYLFNIVSALGFFEIFLFIHALNLSFSLV